MSWPQFVSKEVFAPLNMTHSFFGAKPLDLIADIGVPGGENWADLIVGLGYDPAAGMWVRRQLIRCRISKNGTDMNARAPQTT